MIVAYQYYFKQFHVCLIVDLVIHSMSALERPSAPTASKVTHHTIDLEWEEALHKANDTLHDDKRKIVNADSRVRVQVEQRDGKGTWTNTYTGFAKCFTVENLKPWESYFYRLRFLTDNNSQSDWSPEIIVTTAKQPLTGEDIHSAILRQNKSELDRILETKEAPIDATNKYGSSPLMVCAEKGYIEMIEILIENGADVDFQNDAGKTALMLAAFAGQLETIKELREHGARYDLRDKGGSSALHWAVDSGNTQLIEWILDDGADITLTDLNKWTPLFRVAAIGGNKDVGRTLLQYGADMNWKDKDGKTTLMMAVVNGHQGLVEILLEKNVDISIKNEFGKTAYEMAVSMDRVRVIKTLEEYMDKNGIKYFH